MKTNNTYRLLYVSLLIVMCSWTEIASATVINFTGQLGDFTDNSGGRYSGSILGQLFSGSFSYGLESEATTDPIFPGDYNFTSPPYGGLITDGAIPTTGSTTEPVQVSVGDNDVLDQGTADLLNTLLGTSLSAGSVVDIADIDTIFATPTGGEIVFGLSFISPVSTVWSGNDFSNFPPESGSIDRTIFFIEEFDASDNLLFAGYGELNTIAVVPIPAAVWLFGSGLLGLIGTARYKKATK